MAGAPVKDIFQTLITEQKKDTLSASECETVKRKHHAEIEAEGIKAGPIDVVVQIAMENYRKMPMAVASSGWRDHVLAGLVSYF
jgi:hypothetical protein